MQLINYSNSILSIVPAAIALALAIATRRVLLSLGVGIIVGSFLLVGGNPLDALIHLKDMAVSLTWADGDWSLGKPKILLFLVLLGIFTSLLTHSGSNQAFADWAKQHIKGRRGAKLLTACLVFVTFIDDYFHSLAVGAIARPVTDKFKVSRAKLAYILDSTAAPMCVLMPVSSWGASIIATLRPFGNVQYHRLHTDGRIRGHEPDELLCRLRIDYGVCCCLVLFRYRLNGSFGTRRLKRNS